MPVERALAALAESSRTAGARDSLRVLVAGLATVAATDDAAYYVVDHGETGLRLVESTGRTGDLPRLVDLEPGTDLVDDGAMWDQPSIRRLVDAGWKPMGVRSSLALLGLVVLGTDADTAAREVAALATGLVPATEQLHVNTLLEVVQQPVDYSMQHEAYHAALAVMAQLSSEMAFAAIHELDDDDVLRALAFEGERSDDIDLSDFDVALAESPFLGEVAQSLQPRGVHSLAEGGMNLGALNRLPAMIGMRHYLALPLVADGAFHGLLSLGSRLATHQSGEHLSALAALATAVSVRMIGYQDHHATADDISRLSETAVSITAIEIAQSARHEARAVVGNIRGDASAARAALGRGRKEQVLELLDHIESAAAEINQSLEKIRAATRPPERELALYSLNQLWDEAQAQINAKLNDQRINVRTLDGRIEVEAYVDWLRQVFLNLLLNSADAFRDRGRKGRREIGLRVEDAGEDRVILRYWDTAGGIIDEDFRDLDNPTGLDVEQLIFEPDVTTKTDGSGWGLYLVREILRSHHGGIRLVDKRRGGGVTFDLELPRRQAGAAD